MLAAHVENLPPKHNFPFLAKSNDIYVIITHVDKDNPKVWCGVCIGYVQWSRSVPPIAPPLPRLFNIGDTCNDFDSGKFTKVAQITLTAEV